MYIEPIIKINQFLNNEITIIDFIKQCGYIEQQLPQSKFNEVVNKIKNTIRTFNEDNIKNNEMLILKIEERDETLVFDIEYVKDNKSIERAKYIKLTPILEKKKLEKFGDTYYLIGIDHDDIEYYLVRGTFDCNWYWSGGYIQTFTKYMSDIESHTHYDSGDINGHKFSDLSDDGFKAIFKKTTLNEKETYKFHELLRTFYTASKAMEMAHRGGSHITKNSLQDLIQNEDIYNHYNIVIERIHEEIDKLMTI